MNAPLIIIAFVMLIILLFGMVIFVLAQKNIQASVRRMEVAAAVVAEKLAGTARDLQIAASQRNLMVDTLGRMEDDTHVVAENLASSVSRANAVIGPDGAAADAAVRDDAVRDDADFADL